MKDIVIYSTVRVVLGEHKGKLAVVVGIAECGHKDHDQLALIFIGATGQSSPFYIFRFAVELAAQEAPKPAGIPRVRRFNFNQLVTVTDRGSAYVGQTGRVIRVFDDPVLPDLTGRPDGIFHAAYTLEFDVITERRSVLYDWQLKAAHS